MACVDTKGAPQCSILSSFEFVGHGEVGARSDGAESTLTFHGCFADLVFASRSQRTQHGTTRRTGKSNSTSHLTRWEVVVFSRAELGDKSAGADEEDDDDDDVDHSTQTISKSNSGCVIYAVDNDEVVSVVLDVAASSADIDDEHTEDAIVYCWVVLRGGTVVYLGLGLDDIQPGEQCFPRTSCALRLDRTVTAVAALPALQGSGADGLCVASFRDEYSEVIAIAPRRGDASTTLKVDPYLRTRGKTASLIPCQMSSQPFVYSVLIVVQELGFVDVWSLTANADCSEAVLGAGFKSIFDEEVTSAQASVSCALVTKSALWVGVSDGTIRVIPFASEDDKSRKRRTLQYHRAGSAITGLLEMSLGNAIWSSASDGQIVVWSTSTFQPLGVFSHKTRMPFCSALSAQRLLTTTLITLDTSGCGRVWSVEEEYVAIPTIEVVERRSRDRHGPIANEEAAEVFDLCCAILRGDEQTGQVSTALTKQWPELTYLPDALLCIADVTKQVSKVVDQLGLKQSSLTTDVENICTRAVAPLKRAAAISEMLRTIIDEMYPLPDEVASDPMESLFTRAECLAEQISAAGYILHPSSDPEVVVRTLGGAMKSAVLEPAATPPPKPSPAPVFTPAVETVLKSEHEEIVRQMEAEIIALQDARSQHLQTISTTKTKLSAAENAKLALEAELSDEKESARIAIERLEQQLAQSKKALQKARSEHQRHDNELQELQVQLEEERQMNIKNSTEEHVKEKRLKELEAQLEASLRAREQDRDADRDVIARLEKEIADGRTRERTWKAKADSLRQDLEKLERKYDEYAEEQRVVQNSGKLEELEEELTAKNSIVQELLQIVKENANTIDELNERYASKKKELAVLARRYEDVTGEYPLASRSASSPGLNRTGSRRAAATAGVSDDQHGLSLMSSTSANTGKVKRPSSAREPLPPTPDSSLSSIARSETPSLRDRDQHHRLQYSRSGSELGRPPLNPSSHQRGEYSDPHHSGLYQDLPAPLSNATSMDRPPSMVRAYAPDELGVPRGYTHSATASKSRHVSPAGSMHF